MRTLGFSKEQLLQMQKDQYEHDRCNHADILCLHKADRLKHYGLHYCKYVGRLARGGREIKSAQETVIDTLLVCLSAANTLNQPLTETLREEAGDVGDICLNQFADAAGRFADACEKIDHLEEHVRIAREANQDVAAWICVMCERLELQIQELLIQRRKFLANRLVYK